MSGGNVTYKTANAVPTSGPSPIIWADCPVVTMIKDPGKGIHIFEDYVGKIVDLADDGQYGQFEMVSDGGAGIVVQDTAAYDNEHGVAVMEPDGATQYDEAHMVSPVLTQIAMNSGKKIWLETRIKISDITADLSIIFGLGDATMLQGSAVIEEHATPDFVEARDFVGFVSFTSGTAMHDIDTVYCEVGDAAVTQVQNAARAAASWVNDTYVKLGLRFDGKKTIKFYIDGVELTGSLDVDDFATVTANELTAQGVILGMMCGDAPGAGSSATMSIDWIRFACEA